MRNHTSESGREGVAGTGAGGALSCEGISWETAADCRRCPIRREALFAALRGSDFEHAFRAIRRTVVPPGTMLYQQDASADAVFAVRSGLIKLVMNTPDGGCRIVRLLGRSSAAGLEALTHGFYWHTAITVRETLACRVPLELFDLLEARTAQLADRLVGQWEQQVNAADRWLAQLSVGPVIQRVRCLLRFLADLEGGPNHTLLLPPVEDLASILGVSRESVSRVVAGLKRDQALKRVAPHTYEYRLEALPC